MLTALPDCLARMVICEWLEAESVRQLDTSFCNHGCREILLGLLTDQVIWKVTELNNSSLVWMILRKMTARSISVVGRHCDLELVSQFLLLGAANIRAVRIIMYWGRNDFISLIAKTCSKLIELNCENPIKMSHLSQILQNNPELQSLNIKFSAYEVQDIQIPQLPKLTTLILSLDYSGDAAFASMIIQRAVHLQKLVVRGHHFEYHFVLPVPYVHIKSFKFSRSKSMRASVISIVQQCPNIVNLCLQFCWELTDVDVQLIAQHLYSLRSLDVCSCELLTDESFQYLCDYRADTLDVLYLGNNPYITSAKMEFLRQQCKQLRKLCYVEEIRQRAWTSTPQKIALALKATVLIFRWALTDWYSIDCIVYLPVTILHIEEDGLLCLSDPGMVKLCAKFPNLRTIVVQENVLQSVLTQARGFTHLAITTDPSVYQYDLMCMPI